jgi:SAM-dependent methyltransferase
MTRSDSQSVPPRADAERDYVLGTHDDEIRRLGFQHGVWRDEVHRAWNDAGIIEGAAVGDFGAGPGFASLDLARLVGPRGRVVAIERSARFLSALAEQAAAADLDHITTVEADLMHDGLMQGNPSLTNLDAIWCRWVSCFVPDVGRLVDQFARTLKRGGVVVLHEYVEYSSFQIVPPRGAITEFVAAVYESWRAQGGEPDVARILPRLLVDRGFSIRSARPIAFAARPGETAWNWPAGFVRTNALRLVELGVRNEAWAAEVLRAVDEAEHDPASIFVSPTVLEIIAEKL